MYIYIYIIYIYIHIIEIIQGPPEYGRSCDYCEQVTILAYYSL